MLTNKPSGGILFTTMQKFGLEKNEDKFPQLSDRHNIVVICDEAHRTQYGFKGILDQKTGQIKYGFAKALRDGLPNATLLHLQRTPISQDDRDTQAVFGEYVSIYDIQQAVDDGVTVPIYYESRLSKIDIDSSKHPQIDNEVEEIFEESTDDIEQQEKLKTKWAKLESLAGAQQRLQQIAEDLVNHFTKNRNSTW